MKLSMEWVSVSWCAEGWRVPKEPWHYWRSKTVLPRWITLNKEKKGMSRSIQNGIITAWNSGFFCPLFAPHPWLIFPMGPQWWNDIHLDTGLQSLSQLISFIFCTLFCLSCTGLLRSYLIVYLESLRSSGRPWKVGDESVKAFVSVWQIPF